MSKTWVTKRWVLGAAAASGLIGLVLKVSEISRPGKSTGSAPNHAARSNERREAGAPGARGPADWPSAAPAPGPEAPSAEDREVRSPFDTTHGLATRPSNRHAADGSVREGGTGGHQLGSRSHGAGGPQGGGRRHRSEGLQAAVVGGSGDAAATAGAAGGRTMNERRAPQAVAGQPPGTVPATSDTSANTDVAFDSGDNASYPTDAQVEVPDVKITGQAGTISFWLQPEWGEGNHDDATFVQIADGRLQVIKNVNFLRFEFVDNNGVSGGIGVPIDDCTGKPCQITSTWNGSQFTLYVNGQPRSQTVHDGFVTLRDASLAIGSNYPESRPVAPAMMWGVDVRNRASSAGEVASQYQSVFGSQGAQGTQPGRAPGH